MIKIATILFTYNRSKHTRQVLEALSRNDILPQKLYIFQDGKKESTDETEWNAVGTVIESVSWCETEVIRAEKNKGLADSVVTGINFVLASFDAVIVLEDDCVPHPQFMEYMTGALEKYEKNTQVYSIGATAEPVEIETNGMDAYFIGRFNSCGWGTWKDRWSEYSRDYRILGKIKKDSRLEAWLRLWGEDLEQVLLGNIYGACDSWAVFWALVIISRQGYCLTPYESLVTNIGYDGTGVHCGFESPHLKIRSELKRKEICLPDVVEWVENYERTFVNYYLWSNPQQKLEYYNRIIYAWIDMIKKDQSIAQYLQARGIAAISIWGTGQVCDLLLEDITGKIKVDAIIQTNPTSKEYKGIPVCSYKEIADESNFIVVIPGYIMERIQRLAGEKYVDKLISLEKLIGLVRGKN